MDARATPGTQGFSGCPEASPHLPVTLVVPALGEYQLVVRLSASGYAACVGMDVSEVEDMTTAVTEAFHYLVNQKRTLQSVRVEYACDPSPRASLYLEGDDRELSGGYRADAACVKMVLETLVDTVTTAEDDGRVSEITLLIKRQEH